MESDTILENLKDKLVTEEIDTTDAVDNVVKEEDYGDSYYDDEDNGSVKNEYLMEISSEQGERDNGSADEHEDEDDDEERPLKIIGFGSEDGDVDNEDNKMSDELDGEEVILIEQEDDQRGMKRKSPSEGDDDEISSEDEEDGFAGFEENPVQEEYHRNIKRFAYNNKGTTEQQPSNPQNTNNNTSISNTNNIPKSPAFVVKKGGGPRTIPLSDPIYAKPFEYGWKRELVLRAIPEASKEKGEVYYITPNGKRLRTRHDIYLALTQLGNGNLTLDNFTFSKEPLGLNSDMEIIRSAKLLTNAAKKTELEVSNITHSKRIPKPKVPKGASPPPPSTPSINRSVSNKTIRSVSTVISTPSTAESASSTLDKKSKAKRKSCTIQCVLAMGTIPTLQCKTCTWLYHHECYAVEINSAESFNFICEVCKLELEENRQKQNQNPNEQLTECELQNVSPLQQSPLLPPPPPPPPTQPQPTTNQIILNKKENVVDSLTTWHHYTTNISTNQNIFNTTDIPPQTIASINGRKFIVVPKTNVLSVSPPRDSSSTSTSLKTDSFNNYGFNKFSITRRISNSTPNEESKCENTFSNDTPTAAAAQATSPISHLDSNSLVRKKSGSRTPKSIVTEGDNLNINNLGKLKSVTTSEVGGTTTPQFSQNFFANLSIGYCVLLHTFQYLKVQELLRAGCVCRLWNQAANNAILWRTVRMKNSQVNDWHGFAHTLIKNGTKHLDLRKMLSPKNNPEETWQKFSQSIGKIKNLESIDLCKCSVNVVENLFETNHNLRVLNAVTLKDETINLKNIANLNLLTELRLKSTLGLIINDLAPLQTLQSMRHLSLTSIKDLGTLNLDVLGELTNLESLELGECTEFSTNFVSSVLGKLNSLQRLRLEKGQDNCCTFDILTGVSKMNNLIQLELINFDIKTEFDEHLAKCTNIKKLLLIPTYVSQSATTNQTVLKAVMKLTDSLTNFTWAVTSELVRVTELYVDNCESNRRNKKALSDCIPILKPVPGILDTTQIMSKRAKSDVPQVEILPLTSVEKILSTALPSAKVNMIIIAFHATWRQSLVEN